MAARRHTLPKKQILRGKRAFEYVFEHGSSIRAGVLKLVFCSEVDPSLVQAPVSVAFSAPKRLFRRAVDRNYIKRRIREAFRLHQELLAPPSGQPSLPPIVVLIIYQRPHKLPYAAIEKDLVAGLTKLRYMLYGDPAGH